MVYWAFIKETIRDKKNELSRKLQQNEDKLLFFSAFVRSALSASIDQKDFLKGRIRQIRSNDIDFHQAHFVPLYDLKRIPEVINLEDYRLAYTKHYRQDRKSSVNEFKNILSSIDYLYAVFTQMKEEIAAKAARDYELKLKLQSTYQDAHNITARLLIVRDVMDSEFYRRFLDIGITLQNNHPGFDTDIQFYNDYFSQPLNRFCTDYMVSGLRYPPEITELAILTRDGKQMFLQIKQYNKEIKDMLSVDFWGVMRTILNLRQDSRRLLKDF